MIDHVVLFSFGVVPYSAPWCRSHTFYLLYLLFTTYASTLSNSSSSIHTVWLAVKTPCCHGNSFGSRHPNYPRYLPVTGTMGATLRVSQTNRNIAFKEFFSLPRFIIIYKPLQPDDEVEKKSVVYPMQ